jgi:hypothetical protein
MPLRVTALAVSGLISILTLLGYLRNKPGKMRSKPGEITLLFLISLFILVCGKLFWWLQMTSDKAKSVHIAMLVLGIALVRTILDYSAGRDFMFPDN